MQTPTTYRMWPLDRPGWLAFGVWDARGFRQDAHPREQLEYVLFYDVMPVTWALQVGSAFCNISATLMHQVVEGRLEHARNVAEVEQRNKPLTQEEIERLSIFAKGLEGVDLSPEKKEDPQEQ